MKPLIYRLVCTSPSSRRAWIEINIHVAAYASEGVALLAEGVDRNALTAHSPHGKRWSPSSRRAWIEITDTYIVDIPTEVALLAEGVDRNKTLFAMVGRGAGVALLAEGVDRNSLQ